MTPFQENINTYAPERSTANLDSISRGGGVGLNTGSNNDNVHSYNNMEITPSLVCSSSHFSPSLVSVLGSSSTTRRQRVDFTHFLSKPDTMNWRRGEKDNSSFKISHPSSSSSLDTGVSSPSKKRLKQNRSTMLADFPKTPNRRIRKSTSNTYSIYDTGMKTPPAPPPPSLMSSTLNKNKLGRNYGTPDSVSTIKALSSAPSIQTGDRFIPNRSHMRIDLCRESFLSADKRRLAAIKKGISQGYLGRENGDPRQYPTSGPSSNTREIMTPLQTEFRLRMRGALLNIPLREIRRPVNGGGDHPLTSRNCSRSTGDSLVTPDSNSNLAYAVIPETCDDGLTGQSEDGPSISDREGIKRMLSFRSSIISNSDPSLSTPGTITPKRIGDRRGDNSSSIISLPSFCPTLESAKSRRICSPGWSPTMTDPYSHDQLHVLQRSASLDPLSRGMKDPAILAEIGLKSVASKVGRRINSAPTRILDAPELVDDYYLNLVSWGQNNILAVALGQCVYLWDSDNGEINHLLTLSGEDDYVTSVQWADADSTRSVNNYIAVGSSEGSVQIWDTGAMKMVRTLKGHSARVGSLSWNHHWLSTGGRDSKIIQHDVRSANHIVSTYTGHTQEVCGLKWNDDGSTLASGGNENYLCLWDASMSGSNGAYQGNNRSLGRRNCQSPRVILTEHQAAVKALAWCPFHRGVLASGGGTADRTIKFWNVNSGAILNSIDTGSQVCSLLWSKHRREICSSHGFSENQLILWRYPTMTKIQEFKGHTARVRIIILLCYYFTVLGAISIFLFFNCTSHA